MAMTDPTLDQRLAALETRLTRLESMLGRVGETMERAVAASEQTKAGIQAWVTDYVSLRLQQLVPDTCEHAPDDEVASGPVLPGTRIACTEDVLHRLGRIPIPFVRQMVTQKVAETARAENIGTVDVTFFERAATF